MKQCSARMSRRHRESPVAALSEDAIAGVNSPFRARRYCTGFTLLELIVALSIFAVLAVMAYGGLRSVLDTRERTDHASAQLGELQLAFAALQRDIEQAVNRGVRDSVDTPQPAMRGEAQGEPLLEFTRTGWSNPAGRARSNLQRVAYRLDKGKLVRTTWAALDQAPGTRPQDSPLLEDVEDVEVRFFDQNFRAQNHWPVTSRGQLQSSLPRAIEFTVEVKGWGKITRLFHVIDTTEPQPAVAPAGLLPG